VPRDDLRESARITVRTWNEAQADRYLAQLEDQLARWSASDLVRRAALPARDGAMGAAKGPLRVCWRR